MGVGDGGGVGEGGGEREGRGRGGEKRQIRGGESAAKDEKLAEDLFRQVPFLLLEYHPVGVVNVLKQNWL